jgi:hypothetical protein
MQEDKRMRLIIKVFMVLVAPVFSFAAYNPIEMGYEQPQSVLEILSLKCDTNSLGYVLGLMEAHGFTVLNISCNDNYEPRWLINYCNARTSVDEPV